jgi:hypothetical protein
MSRGCALVCGCGCEVKTAPGDAPDAVPVWHTAPVAPEDLHVTPEAVVELSAADASMAAGAGCGG